MPRNRKRAKERRTRRPDASSGTPRLASATELGTPGPLDHAAPDVELADAQLAVGRPEGFDGDEEELEAELEAEAEAEAQGAHFADGGSGSGGGRQPPGGELAGPGPSSVPEPRARPASRLIGFLQGSWRELQRVQWPDRRQVVQATGVVLGFVVVAGVYLGVADVLAGHVITFILNGHW